MSTAVFTLEKTLVVFQKVHLQLHHFIYFYSLQKALQVLTKVHTIQVQRNAAAPRPAAALRPAGLPPCRLGCRSLAGCCSLVGASSSGTSPWPAADVLLGSWQLILWLLLPVHAKVKQHDHLVAVELLLHVPAGEDQHHQIVVIVSHHVLHVTC